MIRHIFKIIWNERKSNALILLEFIMVFCVLWFCVDYLHSIAKRYFEPRGFDIEHTYRLNIGYREDDTLTEEELELSDDYNENIEAFVERVKRHPSIEAAGLSRYGIPYTFSYMGTSYAIDTVVSGYARMKYVSDEYFDVFKIKMTRGRPFDWDDPAEIDHIVITPDHKGEFVGYPAEKIDRFYSFTATQEFLAPDLTAVGVTEKIKMDDFEPYENTAFISMKKLDVYYPEISVRVSPEADKDFISNFTHDMRDQLKFRNIYLQSITPFSDIRKQKNQENYNTLNGVFAITGFLVVNIFLGVLGTFWFRTQSRRGTIGLHMALGASRRKVKWLLIGETLILLGIAAAAGTVICLNIGQTDLLQSIGVPAIDRAEYGIGGGQDVINFVLTFVFLASISVLAVWYPARQASATQPAQVLHEE